MGETSLRHGAPNRHVSDTGIQRCTSVVHLCRALCRARYCDAQTHAEALYEARYRRLSLHTTGPPRRLPMNTQVVARERPSGFPACDGHRLRRKAAGETHRNGQVLPATAKTGRACTKKAFVAAKPTSHPFPSFLTDDARWVPEVAFSGRWETSPIGFPVADPSSGEASGSHCNV